MQIGAQIVPGEVTSARREQAALRELLDGALHRFPVLALPTLATPPPLLDERRTWLTALTGPINLAGLPALVLPVAAKGDGLPASLQLVGPSGGEETLIGVGRIMAAAAG
jgi:amidase